ncbi:transcriptional repressor [Oscillospiraceae bacterium WX1]
MIATVKKHSRKRDAVLEKIRSTTTHPSALWVYEELRKEIPDLSLATVYRNIAAFKEEGKVITVGVVGGQERYDGTVTEHTHFICLSCGAVRDIEVSVSPSLNDETARQNNVDVLFRQLTFYGNCEKCVSP